MLIFAGQTIRFLLPCILYQIWNNGCLHVAAVCSPRFHFPSPVRHTWKMAHERLSSKKIKKRIVPGIKYSQVGSRTGSSVEINMNKTGYVHLRLSPKPTDQIFPSQQQSASISVSTSADDPHHNSLDYGVGLVHLKLCHFKFCFLPLWLREYRRQKRLSQREPANRWQVANDSNHVYSALITQRRRCKGQRKRI